MESRSCFLVALALFTVVVLTLSPTATAGTVPTQMLYQGYLTGPEGPHDPQTGEYNMTFAVYADSTGGTALWIEDHNNTTRKVTVDYGLFEVMLGEFVPIDPLIFDGSVLWLQTTVNGEDLLPRKPIASSAYAFVAQGNGGPTDHGDLTGLEDDDHPQYMLHTEVSSEAVTSLSEQGEVQLTGDVTLSEGTNVTLVQSGQDIQISAMPGPPGADSIHSEHVREADGTSGQDTNSGFGIKTDHIQDGAVVFGKLSEPMDIGTTDWHWNMTTGRLFIDKPGGYAMRIDNSGSMGDCLMLKSTASDADGSTHVLDATTYKGKAGDFTKYTDDDEYVIRIRAVSSGAEGLYLRGTFYQSGLMARAMETSKGTESIFSVDAPDVMVYCSGDAHLAGGKTDVSFDPLFTEAVSSDVEVLVTVTPVGDWSALYIASADPRGFTVESAGGKADVRFHWMACGRRKGFETRPKISMRDWD